MNWLLAAVAFAVAMMLLSTITSTVTEFLHRICHMRERGLRMILEQLFQDTVWPRVADRLGDRLGNVGKDEACKRFVEQLTRNRAVPTSGWFWKIGEWLAPARITSLSPIELAGRLAETEFGGHLAARAGAAAELAVEDLTRRFERIGADASAYFQQRATTLSLLVAVALAFVLNVDAVRLFNVLASDRALAERLAAQGNAMSPDGAQATPVAPAPASTNDGKAEVQAVAADVERARQQTAEVLASGLPIGSRYFPYCDGGGLGAACVALGALTAQSPSKEAREAYEKSALWGTLGTVGALWHVWLRWLALTLLSGLLIGLGSPFWFNAFTRLSSLLEIGRVLGLRTRYDAEAGNTREAPVQAASAPPTTPAAAFRAALPLAMGRLVLAPGGSPLKR